MCSSASPVSPSIQSTRDSYEVPSGTVLHQIAEVGLVRVQAAVRDGLAPCGSGGAVDREAVAAGPALGEVRLTAREGEDAAAVVRAEVGAGQLVGDVEVPRGRRRVGRADRHAHPLSTAAGVVHDELLLREVDLERRSDVAAAAAATRAPSRPQRSRVRGCAPRSTLPVGTPPRASAASRTPFARRRGQRRHRRGAHAGRPCSLRHPGGQPAHQLEWRRLGFRLLGPRRRGIAPAAARDAERQRGNENDERKAHRRKVAEQCIVLRR